MNNESAVTSFPPAAADAPARTAGAVRGNRARGDSTRQHILNVAIEMIARSGGRHGASISDIAAAAGVSKTGLLHHFPTKDALLNATLDYRDQIDRLGEPTWEITGLELFDQIERDIREWQQRPLALGLFTMLLTENLNPGDPLHERLLERGHAIHDSFAEALERGKVRGDIRAEVDSGVVADMVIAFLNGLETYWQLDPQIPLEAITAQWKATMTLQIATAAGLKGRPTQPG